MRITLIVSPSRMKWFNFTFRKRFMGARALGNERWADGGGGGVVSR